MPSAAAAVTGLRWLGLRTALLTEDNPSAAAAIAAETGVDEVIAGSPPGQKVAVIRNLRAQGRRVGMAEGRVNYWRPPSAADLRRAPGSGIRVATCPRHRIPRRD